MAAGVAGGVEDDFGEAGGFLAGHDQVEADLPNVAVPSGETAGVLGTGLVVVVEVAVTDLDFARQFSVVVAGEFQLHPIRCFGHADVVFRDGDDAGAAALDGDDLAVALCEVEMVGGLQRFQRAAHGHGAADGVATHGVGCQGSDVVLR